MVSLSNHASLSGDLSFDRLRTSGESQLDYFVHTLAGLDRAIAHDGRFPFPVVPAFAGTSVRNILGSYLRRNDG